MRHTCILSMNNRCLPSLVNIPGSFVDHNLICCCERSPVVTAPSEQFSRSVTKKCYSVTACVALALDTVNALLL